MPTDAITGWPYDSSLDAPDGAAQMLRLITAAAGSGGQSTPILHVRDAADRDAKYPTPQPGWIAATTTAPWTIWYYTTQWLAVFSDTGWVTTGFVTGTNWAIGSYMRASKVGQTCYVEGELTRLNTDLTNGTSWNIPDETIVTIPAQFAPGGTNNGGSVNTGRATFTSVDLQLYPSGQIQVTSMHAGSKVGAGDFLRLSFTHRAGQP